MRPITWLGGCLALCLSILPSEAFADSVKGHLGGYHFTASVAQLTSVAGSKSALVAELIQLRHDGTTPFVAIRAEKLLLSLAGEPGVGTALTEDVQNRSFTGLARVIALHIDDIHDQSVRQSVAKQVIARSTDDVPYKTYARALLSSADSSVSTAARSALGQ